ncbi:MAG: disulfide bond formation protein B [Candidatus Paceibacterota bacterium]|jgi:disulfide bond formation protein DsbB
MTEYVHYINLLLGISAIILQIFCVVAILLLFLYSKENKFLAFIKKHFLLLGFIISFFAAVFSLFYSEIVGYLPCNLCWLQRIFIFPQVILFGMAYIKNDRKVAHYAFPLLITGFLISVYQIFIYYFTKGLVPCDASGVSCAQRLIDEIGGYISFPMLGLTSFVVLITILFVARFYKKEQ